MPNPRTTISLAILLASVSLLTAGCCCCTSGGNYGGGSWTPTPSPYIVDVTDANFNSTVLQSEMPVLVDFWAPWCGPCRQVDPVMVAMAEEFHERAKFARLNIDENPATANKYQVWSIPTLALYSGGQLADQHVGVPQGDAKKVTREWLLGHLEK